MNGMHGKLTRTCSGALRFSPAEKANRPAGKIGKNLPAKEKPVRPLFQGEGKSIYLAPGREDSVVDLLNSLRLVKTPLIASNAKSTICRSKVTHIKKVAHRSPTSRISRQISRIFRSFRGAPGQILRHFGDKTATD
jgi:hypothetical protein